MKVLYISSPSFLDVDLSYIRSISSKIEVVYLMDLAPTTLKKTVLNIESQIKKTSILHASMYKELLLFTNYMKCDCYVINRIKGKFISLETIQIYFKIKQFIKQHNPDIIHYNNTVNLGILGCLFNNYKKVITIHDPIPHLGDNNFTNKLIRKLNFIYIKNYILLNKNQRECFIKKYDIDASAVFCSKLGVYDFYTNYYDIQNDKNENDQTILFFGRIAKYKGIAVLLESFTQVKEKFKNAKLIIAGCGKFDFDAYDTQQVTILNKYIEPDALFTLIKKCSIVVCPYTEATQSGVVMTSFSMLKPVIVTHVGGLSEMVTHNETGIIIEPNNSDALRDAITYAFENPNKLDFLSTTIKTKYFDDGEFAWNSIANEIIDIYKELK